MASSRGVCAIIAAAGESRRMGGVDKIFTTVAGRPLLDYSVAAFERSPLIEAIVLVLRPDLVVEGRRMAREFEWRKVVACVEGGKRRQDSVAAGLAALASPSLALPEVPLQPFEAQDRLRWRGEEGKDPHLSGSAGGPLPQTGQGERWVMVHDGARPCVTEEIIARGLAAAKETGSAIAAVPAKDTIKVVDGAHLVVDTPSRERLWLVQTPQVFRHDILSRAYATVKEDVTDDATMVERIGHKVKVFMGAYENIKVTTPEDLAVVEAVLRGRGKEI